MTIDEMIDELVKDQELMCMYVDLYESTATKHRNRDLVLITHYSARKTVCVVDRKLFLELRLGTETPSSAYVRTVLAQPAGEVAREDIFSLAATATFWLIILFPGDAIASTLISAHELS